MPALHRAIKKNKHPLYYTSAQLNKFKGTKFRKTKEITMVIEQYKIYMKYRFNL